MKIAILSCMIFFSTVVLAEDAKQEGQAWVGARALVIEQEKSPTQDAWSTVKDLEMSQSWHYGCQDSDVIVGRERQDGYDYY